jgi:type II secretory pathway component PulC
MFRKVRRVSRYHTRVPQEVVRFYVGHMMRLSRQAIVEPFYDRGMSVGFRIAYLARRSIVRRLGFRLYDVIVGVNGYGVQTKAQAVLAYMALAQQKAFRVTLVRGGKRRVLRIDIR